MSLPSSERTRRKRRGVSVEVEDYDKFLKQVYRTAPIGLCLLDTELRYRHVNEWLASINGLSVEAHLGRTISEVLPDVSAGVESLLRRVMETGEPVLEGVVEAGTPASPHQKRIFQHSYHAIMSDEGIVVGVSCIVQDITERKRAEDALVEARSHLEERVQARTAELTQSELRHRLLLESTQAVPWEADCTTWQFTYVGPQATKLLGYPAQQWLDIDFWTSHIHPEDREFALDYCLRSVKSKADFDFEYRMITRDGRTVWIHDIVHVESEAGVPKTLRGFMINITERRHAQEALHESQRVLQVLSRRLLTAQDEERRGIARELHDDMSQRLAALSIQAEVLEERVGSLTAADRQRARDLAITAQRLATDIQQISRRLHPASLNELGLVRAVRSECAAFAKREGIDVGFDATEIEVELLPEVTLSAFRILQESLHNVTKHARATHVDVSLHASNGTLSLAIADSGCGFDREQHDTAGIGLVSMDERARSIGGRLTVDSMPGEGTAVRLSVPLRNPE